MPAGRLANPEHRPTHDWPTRPINYKPPPAKKCNYQAINRSRIAALGALNRERKDAQANQAALLARRSSPFDAVTPRVYEPRPTSAPPTPRPQSSVVSGSHLGASARVRQASAKPHDGAFAMPKPSAPPGRVGTVWAPPPLMYQVLPDRVEAAAAAMAGGGSGEQCRRERRKAAVPTRDDLLADAASRQPTSARVCSDGAQNFLKLNAESVATTPRKPTTVLAGAPKGTTAMGGRPDERLGSPMTDECKSRFHGRVPPYLLTRKLELAGKLAAAAAAAAPRECPVGTHILPEGERREMLVLIAKAQEKVHAELDEMPLIIDTYGLKLKHEGLTKQLNQLQAAETAFSRSKVVVADEQPTQTADAIDVTTLPYEAVAPVPVDIE